MKPRDSCVPALAVQEQGRPGVFQSDCRLQPLHPRGHLPGPWPQGKSEIRHLQVPGELLKAEAALGVEEQLHTRPMHITASSAYKCK